ncbi:nucleotide-binding alpha-beta plait domain-containing protein [Tanacetum coccineum]
MGSYRSKEDDVAMISTSIYVTNFPDSFSAKDLFHACKQYGHVVDSFIPLKRSQDVPCEYVQDYELIGMETAILESIPAIVLDDECLNSKDLSNSLIGRVKEFVSLSNLKKALCNEGFDNLCVRNPHSNFGGLSTFKRSLAKVGWGGELLDVVDHAGDVHWVRAKEVLGWIPEFLEDEEDDDQSEQGNNDGEPTKERQSEDPFEIYPLLNKDKTDVPRKVNDDEQSFKYPPGFTPDAESNETDINGDQV